MHAPFASRPLRCLNCFGELFSRPFSESPATRGQGRSVIHKTWRGSPLPYLYPFLLPPPKSLTRDAWDGVEMDGGSGRGPCACGVHFLQSMRSRRQIGSPPSRQLLRQRFVFIHKPVLAVVHWLLLSRLKKTNHHHFG